jgi:hypothetical protein
VILTRQDLIAMKSMCLDSFEFNRPLYQLSPEMNEFHSNKGATIITASASTSHIGKEAEEQTAANKARKKCKPSPITVKMT